MYKHLFLIFLGVLAAVAARGQQEALPRSTPEKEGVSSAAVLRYLDAVEKSGIEHHSFMLVRHGKVVAEGWWSPMQADEPHNQYSVSKTFLSTAVGFAVEEKKLSLDDPVVSFFPGKTPDSIPPFLKDMRVKDLLIMAAGQDPAPGFTFETTDWVRAFLAIPVKYRPGSRFLYNSYASYMLSAILQRATGQPLVDYLEPRLFRPLGIERPAWEKGAADIAAGGWGLYARTEDMAKLGLLYLQKGRWNGRQLLPAAWFDEATASHIEQHPELPAAQRRNSDWEQGYGYQLWRSRHGGYRADGAYGQFILVLPEQDAVVALTARNTADMQRQLDLVWTYLLPAFGPAPMASDGASYRALHRKLASLHLPAPAGAASFPGKNSREQHYRFTGDPDLLRGLSYRIWDKTCYLTLQTGNKSYPFELGWKKWVYGQTMRPGPYFLSPRRNTDGLLPGRVAGMYYWTDPQTLVFTWLYPSDGEREVLTCRFQGKEVEASFWNSSRQPGDAVVLKGTWTGEK